MCNEKDQKDNEWTTEITYLSSLKRKKEKDSSSSTQKHLLIQLT
jgi:hypothetical protein